MNSSALNSTYSSMSQLSVGPSKVTEIMTLTYMVLMFISYLFFLFFITLILTIFFTTVQIRENPRYFLFAHMLITDTIYLTLGIFLSVSTIFIPLYMPVPLCYIVITLLTASFKVTPYNLAAMALERYVAICFPLRHAELCTRHNSVLAVVVIWVIGFIPNIVDFTIMISYTKPTFFSLSFKCSKAIFINSPEQDIMRHATNILSFALVGLIIIYTYIRITKIDSGKALASKASKTVILHAIQLLLCMTAFTHAITESYVDKNFIFLPTINFCLFMCLPRFLSPLIFGIRDEAFRASLRRYVLCKPVRANADQFTH
uniref:G-protein coupled receptors family 1 profile domain-containing protein n=1 Tax=Leptobrachium leishanense TaxID=445787 RepID=A0A8C5LYW0_9ANUR